MRSACRGWAPSLSMPGIVSFWDWCPSVLLCSYIFFFFFSSRRRHTRSDRDWSSDVCSSDLSSDPLLYVYLEIVGSLLSFTYAANGLVRFRGTHDRTSLILAFGFVLSGLIETTATFGIFGTLAGGAAAQMRVPLAWMVSRTLLAGLMVAALFVARRMPNARDPGRETATASLIVGAVAYLTSAVYLGAPAEFRIRPSAWVARPWDLIPAALFLVAAIGIRRRLRTGVSAFDQALSWAA